MTRRVLAFVLIASLALSPGAHAQVSDPGMGVWLAKIQLWLETVLEPGLELYDEMQIQVYNNVRWVQYAKHATDAMRQLKASARGIRRELQDLSCQFDTSFRTDVLRGLWLGNFKFCKPSWTTVFGRDPYDLDSDRGALYDRTSALSYNQLSERFDAEHGSWDRVFNEQNLEVATCRYSPAEADRLGALNAAWLTNVELSNKRIDDQILLTRELRFADRRRRARLDHIAGLAMWQTALGEDIGDTP